MDSGCLYHSCPRKDYFETLELKIAGTILLGGNYPCKVQGIGTVRLKMFDNRDYILKDVRYISKWCSYDFNWIFEWCSYGFKWIFSHS